MVVVCPPLQSVSTCNTGSSVSTDPEARFAGSGAQRPGDVYRRKTPATACQAFT